MAQESWLIEFMTAMVFSNGGHFTDDKGNAVMQASKGRSASPARRVPERRSSDGTDRSGPGTRTG